jgi:asparagine synthase (glutamine-hydrolysing)
MCGICGAIWLPEGKPVPHDVLQRMTDVLAHRGPDDEGLYESCCQLEIGRSGEMCVALGHRRLAIIDRQGGHQPLANEDGQVQVVFNGEIYNYLELRHRLEGAGHHFRTNCDTEVLVHLYEDEGTDFLRHLNGMFALALWDQRRRRLILARDRLGQKPLCYREEAGRLLFASELKSLLEVPEVPRQLDPSALDAYLTYQYVPHPQSIFRGMAKLPPGHFAIYDQQGLKVEPFWQPDFNLVRPGSAQQYRQQLEELLVSAVELRLQSDVPLGAFLSGGIDSSIIVALMQRAADHKVKTFSIGFPIAEYDESGYARRVAQHLGTEHEEFHVEPQALDVLPRLVEQYDEPLADSSAIPTYYVSQLTRQQVTVALTGDGGDELFAGYPRYRAVRIAAALDRLPRPMRSLLGSGLWQRLPSSNRQRSLLRRGKRFLSALGQSPARRYLDWIAIFNETRRGQLYSDAFLSELPPRDPFDFLAASFQRAARRDPVTTVSMADLQTYLPCDLMTKVDMASMAHGLECRSPFLDYRVVELAAAMPIELKFRRLRGKRLLAETFGHLLPREVLRRPKMGFGVPLAHWFRHELRDFARDVLLDSVTLQRGYFRPEAIRLLVDEHQNGSFDHGYRLWALLFFELWHRRWLDPGA